MMVAESADCRLSFLRCGPDWCTEGTWKWSAAPRARLGERPSSHFPERVEDRSAFNGPFRGRPARFPINGEVFVRVQFKARTRRIGALRAAWIVATGAYPVGVIEARDGDPFNLRPGCRLSW